MTRISIVIPTRNRFASLTKLLHSIISQRSLPSEVIIVDDSDDDKTSKLVKEHHNAFSSKGISLEYLHGNEENRSISAARNLGSTRSVGDIVLFIDDDVVLDKEYINEILRTYEEYPKSKGVQGYIVTGGIALSNFRSILLNSINKIFFMDHLEKNKCSYQLGLTYPYSPDRIVQCQWLHGTNMSVRREVLQSFRFDENLIRRSIGEDVDFSYRIYKRFPNSLFMNSRARLIHISTSKSSKSVTYRATAYLVYFFLKNHKQTFGNRLLFSWSLLGRLIVRPCLYLMASGDVKPILWSIKSFTHTLNHIKSVENGDFCFLES